MRKGRYGGNEVARERRGRERKATTKLGGGKGGKGYRGQNGEREKGRERKRLEG